MFDKTEPWRKNVPADLISAVKYLRKSFDDVYWGCGWSTKLFCYAILHNAEVDDPRKEYFNYLAYTKAKVGAAATLRFHDLLKQGTAPAVFKAFFDFYRDGMTVEALRILRDLTEIGRANQGRLDVPFLEWAEAQATDLVRAYPHRIQIWIRDVCDKRVHDPNEEDNEHVFWRKWQAPRLILMTPSRSQPCEAERTWERYDSESSSRFLEAFARDFLSRIEARLREASGEAALAVAKAPPEMRADAGPSTGYPATPLNDDSRIAPAIRTDPELTDPELSHTEDYRSLRYNGREHTLTPRQATMVELLHGAYLSGYADVPKSKLLGAVEAETSEVRDSFRGSPLWNTLIRRGGRKGTYRLSLGDGHRQGNA